MSDVSGPGEPEALPPSRRSTPADRFMVLRSGRLQGRPTRSPGRQRSRPALRAPEHLHRRPPRLDPRLRLLRRERHRPRCGRTSLQDRLPAASDGGSHLMGGGTRPSSIQPIEVHGP